MARGIPLGLDCHCLLLPDGCDCHRRKRDCVRPLIRPPTSRSAPPVIPDRAFNINDFGGVGDGETLNTDAFKKAVAAIEAAGGGHLRFRRGFT